MSALWKNWLVITAAAALVILAIAHGFETFGHLAPCELCLKEREGYWIALELAVVGFVATRRDWLWPRLLPWFCVALALVFAADAALSVYHAGVEWKVWPGPAACTGGGHRVSIADMQRLLRGGSMAVPQCDKPAWVFLGLSMSGWNLLLALSLAAASLVAAVVNFRTRMKPA
jgi:disulfide bond formation protein DsbB